MFFSRPIGWPICRENRNSFMRWSGARACRMTSSVPSGEGSIAKIISNSLLILFRIASTRPRNSRMFFSCLYTGTTIEINIAFCLNSGDVRIQQSQHTRIERLACWCLDRSLIEGEIANCDPIRLRVSLGEHAELNLLSLRGQCEFILAPYRRIIVD